MQLFLLYVITRDPDYRMSYVQTGGLRLVLLAVGEVLDRLLAGQHAGAHHAGVAHQQRAAQLGVLAHHIE